ncbi:probable sodium/potassium-transporting ATPase subunit beta-3 [Drosophila serrata]|uniref:probable sodium/potassium-transporting ATPase subunit beta-3 n=1 Tax=Drosophila serrata TaxID=7274 RepID=UPI000A1D058A|nr:probable sodium/potassium-transporting ATPase subunit beta-3 [Drosophila serrata]
MPNSAVIYSGVYELDRLRRRRDRRVQEYIHHRSRRVYQPPPPVTMCRIIKYLIYITIFFAVLALVTGAMVLLIIHFRLPADKPAVTKIPGLCTVPGTHVGDEKHIVFGHNLIKEMAAFRREIDRHVDEFGIVGQKRMTECNTDLFWGYATGKPCILLKLTQSLGFKPITYNSALDLPEEAPHDVFYHVIARPKDQRVNRIWPACKVQENDGLNIKIKYIPERYFEITDLFTTYNTSSKNLDEGDDEDPGLKRFIGVQFLNIPPNRDIFIDCQVWAKNIPLKAGSAKFRLRLVEPVPPKPEVIDDLES